MLKKKIFLPITALLLLLLSYGCQRFEGDQEIPAYLQIDTIALEYTPAYPGITPTSRIVDAWVYVDDWLLGDFQLPLKVPVLKRGECKLTVYPGILVNELSLQRRGYAFYTKYETTVHFAEDSVTRIKEIKTNIDPKTHFSMNETFDDANIAFDTLSANNRTAGIDRIPIAELDLEDRLYGGYVGGVALTEENPGFLIMTKEKFKDLPSSKDIIVEVDYCSNHPFIFGIQYEYNGKTERHDMLFLSAQKKMEWNKAYINIAPRITELNISYYATNYQLYFGADLESGAESAQFYFDNIRLIRPKTE